MDIEEAINRRRSIRSFTGDDVSEETLRQIIEAGILAPSAGNCQPWEFIIVRDKATKQKLAEVALGQRFVSQAPVVIVVCANIKRSTNRYGSRGQELYCVQDTAAAIENMLLMAVSKGLGTCWVGAFNEVLAKDVLVLPVGIRPVAIIPLGHPAETLQMPRRRNYKDVVHNEKW
ncbi:MAG: nitroreductase family protein [Promethearchaeota archaeon]